MTRQQLLILGGIVLILIGAAFLLINRMQQTVWVFLPALAAILIGVGVIWWRLPRG